LEIEDPEKFGLRETGTSKRLCKAEAGKRGSSATNCGDVMAGTMLFPVPDATLHDI
jgi:hypothetical protein